jgi:hypothetical protein
MRDMSFHTMYKPTTYISSEKLRIFDSVQSLPFIKWLSEYVSELTV